MDPESDASSSTASAPPNSDLEAAFKRDALALRERYQLEEVLAVGVDSIVYKARDARGDRHSSSTPVVAIKTLRPEVRDSAVALARLTREFRQGAALNHANLVRMHELANASGVWFIAMEWLEGNSLAALLYELQPNGLHPARALAILRACSRALAAAHERRIAHGDFRPGNVWLSPSDEVHVLGFGAEQKRTSAASDGPVDEISLPYVATPSYASPEVLAGQLPDSRDDVFSIACVAYELLSGQHPFGRLNAVEMKASRLRIARPKGMSMRRWLALKRGMHWSRAKRTASVQLLLNRLEGAFACAASAAPAVPIHHTRNWFVSLMSAVAALRPTIRTRPMLIGLLRRLSTEFIRFAAPRLSASTHTIRRASVFALLRSHTLLVVGHAAYTAARAWSPRQSIGSARSFGSRSIAVTQIWITQREQWMRDRWRVLASRSIASKPLPFIARLDYRVASASAAALIMMGFTILASDTALRESPDLSSSADAGLHSLRPYSARASLFDEPVLDLPHHIDGSAARWRSSSLNALNTLNSLGIERVAESGSIFETDPQFKAIVYAQRKAPRPIAPRSIIALEHAQVDVSEEAVAAVLMLRRSGSTREPAVVRWRTIVGSAKPGADYQEVSSGVARFVDHQALRAIYIPLVPNRLAQGHRTFEVELTRASNGATLGKTKRVMVTIRGRG